MSTWEAIVKRASDAISNLRGDDSTTIEIKQALKILGDTNELLLGKDGDIVFSKNNVCVHPPSTSNDDIEHLPGYLSIHCQVHTEEYERKNRIYRRMTHTWA